MNRIYLLFLSSLFMWACNTSPAPNLYDDVRVDLEYNLLPGGARIVSGTFINPTQHLIKAAQIQVSLFDKNNIRVSAMSIMVKDIPAGESKAFRQPVDDDQDIRGASVKNVLVL